MDLCANVMGRIFAHVVSMPHYYLITCVVWKIHNRRNIRTISTGWAEFEVGSMFGAYLHTKAPSRSKDGRSNSITTRP
jgi:hypothetical protein